MSIAKLCIKHRVTTILAVIMITVFGAVFSTQLQMSLLPEMELPAAYVMCYYNGASPSDMEELVTRPLESAIMSVSGVDSVQSSSSDGVATVQISYVDGTDVDIAATKLRERFDMLSLPDGCSDPVIMNLNISEMMPSAMVALKGSDLSQLQSLADDVVVPALERIDGVASVSVYGGVTQEIAVGIDQSVAMGYGLSNSYIAGCLASENLLYPGGELQSGSQTLTVSTDAKLTGVEDVANILIPLPAGGSIRLGEIAAVELVSNESDTVAKTDGSACVILQVSKQSGANEVSTANAVAERMAELSAENRSVDYSLPYLATDYIMMAVNSALQNIAMGVALAAIVVFLFLRRFGATMTIAVSMPVCILTVFVLMYACDLTMNMMSLGGIAMGVGMIVDNSIIVLENIYRYAADGHSRMEACVEGTKEISASVTASTLTTAAVFVPLGLSGGMAGMLFKDFCLTIAFLILGSMVIALTLVPLLCYFLLDETKVRSRKLKQAAEEQQKGESLAHRLMDKYERLLSYFVHHPARGMIVSVALVVIFAASCLSTKMVLMPSMDQGMVSVSVSMPIGSEPEDTAAIADRISAIAIDTVPELNDMYYISQAESASVTLNLVDKTERSRTSDEVANDLREQLRDIAGCEISVNASDMTAMVSSGGDISLDITGDDYNTLAMIADDLVNRISELPDAIDVTSSLAERVPQVEISIQRDAASQYGLTASAIGSAVRSELTGTTATAVTINNREYDVVVRGNGRAAESLDALRSLQISTPYGGTVPLSTVASVNVIQAPQTINRVNQSREVSVTGDTISGNVTAMTANIQEILDGYALPEGYTVEISGAYADMQDNYSDLLLALFVALCLVYFVLAAQFESFVMPVIIMMILPIAFSGALFALPVTGRDISMISMVALIMLAGTVVNASIILVDYIKIRRDRGESREEAILHACPLRIRPVLMTTLTTILALIPMALGIGGSNEMMSDMGITMISGMLISTVITLVFTPVFYIVIDNLRGVFRRKRRAEAE